ncbi:MAG: sensor histidine kinase [Anaerolineales bacterium]|nr:sensor histidine kinase [Anaerolineales bacterium]NUQ84641.1 sensor histidine kinase [Anaerolineales bacterium]
MKQIFSGSNPNVFLIVSLAMWASVALRWTLEFAEQQHPLRWLLNAILIAYAVLMIVNPLIIRDSKPGAHIYLAVQTALIIWGMLLYYELDFFAILFMPLGGQAVFILPRRKAITWILIFGIAIVIGQLTQFEFPNGLPFTFLYLAGLFFVASFSTTMLRVNRERIQSDRLLDELQQAHRQLQEYAGQAEELATAKERNRLARELHDSVAQTLYGLTLQAEAAARELDNGQTDKAAEQMREIRDSAQQTLQETRLLIFELRPPILEQEGLVSALRNRLESVESRSGIKVQMLLQEVGQVRAEVEAGLYGISNEALNNILKHAHATVIKVSLKKEAGRIVLEIRDNGIGFDIHGTFGGMGLSGMKERAEQFGGVLQIQGGANGTTIRVEVTDE